VISRLVIATHNPKKAGEMLMILGDRFPELELRTLADYSGAPEPEETGSTFAENAAIKAESARQFTGEWCVADDAGLEVEALDGAPGLYSKRFGGEELPFPEKIALLLSKMNEVPNRGRNARFNCCVALAGPGHRTELFQATCEGVIAPSPSGGGGFGYDPIFFLPELGRTMAELSPAEKHAISHRGKVLRAFSQRWQEITTNTA
jgi:XTP/dITP diphosphohydrolase